MSEIELLHHHAENFRELIQISGLSSKFLATQSAYSLRSMKAKDGSIAYPNLQTDRGFTEYVDTMVLALEALRSGKVTEISEHDKIGDKQFDVICRTCGNLTKGNRCRLDEIGIF